MRRSRIIPVLLLLALCLALTGCRVRTGQEEPDRGENPGTENRSMPAEASGSAAEEGTDEAEDPPERTGEAGGRTRENPDADRKEFDDTRPAEVMPGTERALSDSGEGSGFSGRGEGADRPAASLAEDAEQTAVRTVSAEEAEEKGVSEDAKEADSAATYYSVLLKERTGSLFECERQNVYWETAEDHVTVFRTSPEHLLILEAGGYDVSARLLEGNLRVDDGWIGRKNPGVVVKIVGRSVLGTGISSTGTAERIYAGLLARDGWQNLDAVKNRRVVLLSEELLEAPHLRLAAALIIAKTATPDPFGDVDPGRALAMLREEAAGSDPEGIWFFTESAP